MDKKQIRLKIRDKYFHGEDYSHTQLFYTNLNELTDLFIELAPKKELEKAHDCSKESKLYEEGFEHGKRWAIENSTKSELIPFQVRPDIDDEKYDDNWPKDSIEDFLWQECDAQNDVVRKIMRFLEKFGSSGKESK